MFLAEPGGQHRGRRAGRVVSRALCEFHQRRTLRPRRTGAVGDAVPEGSARPARRLGRALCAAAHAVRPEIGGLNEIIEQARTDQALQGAFHQTLTPRHPSQIYEALLEGAFLFACLWFLRVRTKQPRGMLAGLFLLLYALVRVVVEFFREPDAPLTGPFTRGQTLSVMLILGGICFIVYALKAREYEAAQR